MNFLSNYTSASSPQSLRGYFSRSACLVVAGVAAAAVLWSVGGACAQTTTLLPSTITSIAGNTPTTSTLNAACPTNAQFTAIDANGDGCPAVNAVIPSVVTGIAVDPEGNVYLSSNTNKPQLIQKIDARTGLITAFAGAASGQCASGAGTTIYGTVAAQQDKTGDNCPVSSSYQFNGPVSLGTDPYGNLLIGTTGDNVVHFVCNAVSPICSAQAASENLMVRVAGCSVTGGADSYGTAFAGNTAVGTGGDGSSATQYSGTSCTTGVGGRVYAPTADKWDNVYFMDGSNGRLRVVAGPASIVVNGVTLANPLYAVLATSTGTGMDYSTPIAGDIYPIAGGGTVCSGATDTEGDGCPFYQTLVNTSSTGSLVQGTAVDHDGDFIFDDGAGNLRVIYMGGTVIKGALAANGITSPQIGYSYRLVGGGTPIYYNSGNPGIVLGTSAGLQSGAIQTLAVDPAGNILIGDQMQVLFYDIATGYIRRLGTANGATLCNSSAVGDGCPLGQSKFGVANKVLPIAEDSLGNLYMLDINDLLVRRVSTLTLPSTVVNSAANTATTSSTITVHSPTAGAAVTLAAGSGSDFTVGTPSCTTNSSSDNSVDCTAALTFAPQMLAQRSDPLLVTTTGASTTTQSLAFTGNATGSALIFDSSTNPTTNVLGSKTAGNSTVLLDGSGNVYVSGTQGISRISGSTVTLVSATAAAYVAVDTAGDVYATNGAATSVTEYLYSPATGGYTASTVALPSVNVCATTTSSISCTATQAYSGPMVVDAYGFLYFADQVNKQVIKYSPTTGIAVQVTQTALSSPTAMGEDSYGNLLVIDGTTVLKIPSSGFAVTASSPVANPTLTFSTPLVAPTSVTADQGGNVYVADGGKIDVLPVSGGEYTVPGIAGASVAVDGAGNLYTVSTGVAGVTEDVRDAAAFDFGTSITESYNGVFANAGATSPTGFGETDTSGNFTLSTPASGSAVAASAPVCNLSSTVLPGGSICNASIAFTPTANGSGVVQDVITLLPATDTLGSVTMSGTKSGTNASTTTAVSGSTNGLIYSSGTEATFSVTVAETPAAVPSGSVAVTIDGGTAVNYTLAAVNGSSTSATATVTVSGLRAGAHTISAAYASSAGIVGSTSSATDFTIGQASTTVAWTPGTTTQQYSAAVGAAVLDAIAAPGSGVGSVAGSFLYTATPSGGSAIAIHPASYLPIGTYALAVTFVPTDSVDYATSTGAVASYSVTKANTTAAVGATQMLVASDGTGNYSSVQAAVNQLPTGGTVYIKPGTYTGFVTIVQPNVSLIGLGGDPTKVILTSESGAFGSSYPYIGAFTAANSNGSQLPSGSTVFTGDEGSATMVISKGVNTALSAVQQTPGNFYGEDFTILNTYDSDSTTTTTTYAPTSNGTCATGQSPAQTYASLFNTGQLCASQALAIWTTADLAVMNNIYATSLQDTIYAASPGSGSNGYVPTRQYWFRGKVTGDVDYIFGDAAAVFDSTSIYTMWHGATATGEETIEAQNKANETGTSGDYLSGYVMNNDVFTSQSSGMTNLYLGRPYGTYSTWIMLNSYVDQVNAAGYTTGLNPALTDATYTEYNDTAYTDPTTGSADLNGIPYLGTGGNTGQGVNGVREAVSTNPGTPMALNNPPTSMTQAQAQAYFPDNFLGQTVSSALSTTQNWVPTNSIAAYANGFVPAGSAMTVAAGSSVTVLIRPQTPGLGAITNGMYTIPTGTYTLSDTYGGSTTALATGTLDAAGEASYTSSTLGAGVHDLSWTYSGDSNFNSSTTASPYVLTVTGASTSTTLSAVANPITFGQSASIKATVSAGSGVPTGTVVLTIDGGTTQSLPLSGGVVYFTVTGLGTGVHNFSASYGGSTAYSGSVTATNLSVTVAPYTPVLTWATPTAIVYGQPLSTTQLNASVAGTNGTLAGNYTYNPAAGVYLPAGTNEALSVSFTPTDATDYSNVSGATTINVNKASTTLTGPTTQPVLVASAQAGTIPVTIVGQYSGTGITAPSGGVTYAVVNASSATVASGTATIASGAVSVPVASTLASGLYTVNVSYAGDTNYAASTAPVAIHLQVGQIQPTISWATPAAISYGTSLAGVLNAGAYNGATAVPGTYSYLNGSTAITAATALPAGSYTLTVNFVPTDATTYESATGTVMLTVNKVAPGSVSIVSSINPLLVDNATVFTATVSSTVSTPSGSVNFYDTTNATSLGTVNLSNGIATLSVSSLAVGTHSVTAIYSGDTNFLTATSSAVSEVVQDYTLSIGGGSGSASQTVSPGGTATYNFTLTPSGATFPAAVNLTVSGLPTGATYTITPATIAAGSGATNVTLSVNVPKEAAAVHSPGGFAPIALGLLLLPFSFGLRKRTGRIRRLTAVLLLLVGGTVCTGMMTGCGSSPSQSPQSYTLTITGTSGTLSHSTTVTLTVQ